jgi:uncharacterized protein
MPSITQKLSNDKLITPPNWLPQNVQYEVMMGSIAYGCSNDASDCDIYGFCIPNKEIVFPAEAGHIEGFGHKQTFDQYQQHHIKTQDAEYDLCIFNITKYFQLLMDNNPNALDSLFVPVHCVRHITQVGNLLRDNKRIFLHKGCYHKFRGYAFSQLNKIKERTKDVNNIISFENEHNIPRKTTLLESQEAQTNKDKFLWAKDLSQEVRNKYAEIYRNGQLNSKRCESTKIHEFDVKFAYHVARLTDECEQILLTGDLDLQRSKEYMKAIRRGDVPEQELRSFFDEKIKYLEKLYETSTLQYSPDEGAIKTLLVNCLEMHYGSLNNVLKIPNREAKALEEIKKVMEKYGI